MSTSVGSTMEGRRSQNYETAGMDRPRGNRSSYRLDSPAHSRADVLERGREQVKQFHKMLLDVIKRDSSPGLKKALALYEGYFGYFGDR